MYKRITQGWLKHFDFVILDAMCQQLAFVIAHWIRQGGGHAYSSPLYRSLAVVILLMDMLVIAMFNTMHNVVKRGYLVELWESLRHVVLVLAAATLYLFATQSGDAYSRIVLMLTSAFHLALGYGVRVLWKIHLKKRGSPFFKRQSMLVVLRPETADATMRKLLSQPLDGYNIVGAVMTGAAEDSNVEGVPVVCSLEDASRYICREWIDNVYIDAPASDPGIARLMSDCREMAVPVHYHVSGVGREGAKQFVEKIGGTTVLTTTINYASASQVFAKRLLDILGGIAGSLLALIIIAIIGPKIKKESPGPILYKSERIGLNGKKFYMIKIRSMYLDADARKADLMAQNRVKDGMMFKLDFDPRIIGNVELPDGTRKTGIGDFIRRTSLDEFPQFFNVLKGDMSLVGTRPPTPDEWEKYELHHRARLATKPGITGMWQVSGRSEITDFEEVVKLDTEYIENWSMGLDIRILLKTLKTVFKKEGAM